MKPIGNAALRAQLALRSQTRPQRLFQGRQTITLLQGTSVMTSAGARPAEIIRPGDQLLTRTRGMAEVAAVRSRRAMVQTVRFAAAAEDGGSQLLPWDQRVLVRDRRAQAMFGQPQAVVPAYELVDGETVCDLGLQMMDLVALEFSRPHVIYAGALELTAAAAPHEDLRPAA